MSSAPVTPILIYGAGGHARETALLIDAMIEAGTPWTLRGFLSDDAAQHGRDIDGRRVLGNHTLLEQQPGEFLVALGIGDGRTRHALVERTRASARGFPVLMHPSVPRCARVSFGEGTQVHAGTILTVDAHVGAFVILNRRVDVSHDCVIGDFATLAPSVSLAGGVRIGVGAELGIRAACIPSVSVGDWARIGAGAVVVRDIPCGETAVGVPARCLSSVSR
ncbi:MAG: acetyltransferase [Gemmatimonadaceae bacterium]|nr:acetyltransferase [Gemmatimonadaceae bacterium]